jgi:hypothetical protein
MKNQILSAFKNNQIVVALKNQIVIAFIVVGAIIIAPVIFIVVLIRLAYERGAWAVLARPVSEKLDAAWRWGEAAIARRRVDAVE